MTASSGGQTCSYLNNSYRVYREPCKLQSFALLNNSKLKEFGFLGIVHGTTKTKA
jgi:hypothetical protein